MASDAHTPDPRSGIQRRSSQLGALLAFILPTVFGLWVVFGFSNPTNAVKDYTAVPRAPYQPALPPETASLVGQPPNSSYAHPKDPTSSVRTINVSPSAVELRIGGKIIRTIPTPRSTSTTLDAVTRSVGDPTWISESEPGVFDVSTALVFREGAGLSATAPSTTAVHFGAAPGIFLAIDGSSTSQITGVSFDAPASPWAGALTYRPFLLFDQGAAVNVASSSFTGLGWDWNMSYGLSWMRGATGSLTDSTVDANFIGFYCQQVSGVKIVGNTFKNNHLYGIDPHTGSSHLLVSRNVATHNGAHGIIFANNVSNSVLLGNVSSYNGESGVVMYQGSNNNTIKANLIEHNAGDGIVLTVHSTGASLINNVVEHNRIGILSENSNPVGTLSANKVMQNTQAEKGVSLSTGTNQVDLTETGIILTPPPSWHWVFTWILWPLTFAFIFFIFYRRRLELRAGWHVAQAEEGLPTDPEPHRWRDLMAGIRRALAIQVKTRDSIYQPAAPVPLAFQGPPPIVAPFELPEPVTIGAHGEDLFSTGDESGTDPGDRRFRPDVQGLRALAVTLVVLYHAGVPWLTGGYVGVDVFFVVSGFVITGLLLRERSNSGKTSLLAFYARRARRILPAASLVTVFIVLATYHWLGFIQGARAAVSGRWAAVFLANLNDIRMGTNYFSATAKTSPFLHYWSLSVEEQFYVVFPFLFAAVALLFRSRSLRAKLAVVLSAIIICSLALSVLQTHSSPVVAYFSPFTRAWELALGGLLASAGPVLRRLKNLPATAITWIGLVGILVAGIAYSGSTVYPGIAVALPVVATALVIAGGSVAPRYGSEFVLGRWLGVKGGDISYSLYLWHFPILVIAAEAATSPLSASARAGLVLLAMIASIITNVAFENPVRHSASLVQSTSKSLAVGAALIAGVVVFTSALATVPGGSAASKSAGPSAPTSTASLTQLHLQISKATQQNSLPTELIPPLADVQASGITSKSIPPECVVSTESQSTVKLCNLGATAAKRTVVLLGDSQASMWAGGFDLAAKQQGWKLVVLAKDGCPPWLQHYQTQGLAAYPACDAWHAFALRTIASLHPQAVIATGSIGALANTTSTSVSRLVAALRASGAKVGILSNIPRFDNTTTPAPPDCLVQHPTSLKVCDLSYPAFLTSHHSFRSTLRDGATKGGGSFVDLDPLFCTSRTCPVVIANHEVYYDLEHITGTYSTFVAKPLAEVLARSVGF